MEYVLPERNRSGPGCKSVPDRIPHPELKVEMILGVSPRHMILSLRWRWTKGPHTLRTPRHPRPLAKFLYYTTMSALKQGEFVGSLDCGTTCVTFTLMTSYSSIMFISYTALRDSLSLINMRIQSLTDSSSFHSIIPSLGASLVFSNVSLNFNSHLHRRWHEHDAEEIMDVCNTCIDEACKDLESAGWSKDSVKVIGQCL